MNLLKQINEIRSQGYEQEDAEARLWQDIILQAIAESSFNQNITVKGGVVMSRISNSIRRATRDLDLDFIHYSLQDDAIEQFIEALNCLKGVHIRKTGQIEELHQQDYNGKRVHVEISDQYGNTIVSKIDLGVHRDLTIVQEEYWFDINFSEKGVCIFVNSKEQMFTEKLCSLLKFGPYSTRYKDVYDMCYLAQYIDSNKLLYCFKQYIVTNARMKENNLEDICRRISKTFSNDRYKSRVANSNTNWIDMEISTVLQTIEEFLKDMIKNNDKRMAI